MIWARIRLFFHCLFKLHCSMKAWDDEGTFYLDCNDCGDFKEWVRSDYVEKSE